MTPLQQEAESTDPVTPHESPAPETTLTEAAAKNLSARVPPGSESSPTPWKSKPVRNARRYRAAFQRLAPARPNPVSMPFTSITTRAACRPNPGSCVCSISPSWQKEPPVGSSEIPVCRKNIPES